jgi:hypothetical protein
MQNFGKKEVMRKNTLKKILARQVFFELTLLIETRSGI